jgi:hypothetical protein
MKKFWVYYRKEPTFRTYGKAQKETEVQTVYDMNERSVWVNPNIYQFVAMTWADDIDHVFHTMQGEVWSPNGEARSLIRALGLDHTSMSVGDLVVTEDGDAFECDMVGWKDIKVNG